MKSRIILIVVVLAVLGMALAFPRFMNKPLVSSGIIEADEIRLGSQVGGRVASVRVEEGDHVEPRQALIQLEPFDLLKREKEAEATLAARQAEYERLKSGLRAEEIAQAKARVEQLQARLRLLEEGPRQQEIDAAKARVTAAKAQAKLAKQRYDRVAELAQTNTASRENLDRAVEEHQAAQAMVVVRERELDLLEAGTREEELEEARARLEEARQALVLAEKGFRSEEIAQAKAARDAAQAALEALRERKEELIIRSPVSGVVEALELQQGDLVAAGAPALSILDANRLWIRTYAPLNVRDLQVGDRLRVTVDGLPGEKFQGEVVYIARQAEFTPSNVQTPEERSKLVFRIKVMLHGDTSKLRPGMAADVWLEPLDEQS